MPVTPPIPPEKAPENIQSIYERIKETIGNGSVPVGYQMMAHVEPFLQDSYMNFRKFIKDGAGKLDPKTRYAIALAASSANNCRHCVAHHVKENAAAGWSEKEIAEILAVTATCAMYNSYFKFQDLAGDDRFKSFSVGLRAFTFAKVSLDQKLVELINIVVSNINGCHKCTSGHTAKALDLGVTPEEIDEAVKVASTMAAFNVYHRTQ